MIYILTALSAEARPVIEALHLKKKTAAGRFRIYENERQTVMLVITGPGGILSAAAVGMLLGTAEKETSFLISFGCCADISAAGLKADQKDSAVGLFFDEQSSAAELNRNKKIPVAGMAADRRELETRDEQPSGQKKLYLANKLINSDSGRTFYPDLLIQSSLPEAEIITGSRVLNAPEEVPQASGYTASRGETGPVLYDMESAAIYEAGSAFLGPHQMSFLRRVSDCGEGELVSADDVDRCVRAVLPEFLSYCGKAEQFLRETEDACSCRRQKLSGKDRKDTAGRHEQSSSEKPGKNAAGRYEQNRPEKQGQENTGRDEWSLPGKQDEDTREQGEWQKQNKVLEKLAADLHCSATMRHQLEQLLRYCAAAGIAWDQPVHTMYERGILPAGDRREGKKALAYLNAELIQSE